MQEDAGALRVASMPALGATIGSEPMDTTMDEDPAELAEQIDSVVNNVLETLRRSASLETLAELTAGKPSIPREIDKALLTDLSDRRGGADLSETVRHKLRAQFWENMTSLGYRSEG